MKSLRNLLFAAALMLGVSPAMAVENVGLVRTVDSFDFLMDYSGSMMMTHPGIKLVKLTAAKEVVGKVNAGIPDLGYAASMHTFAPASTVVPYGAWNQAAYGQALTTLSSDMPIFGRLTPMGNNLLTPLSGEIAKMARPTALILVTDGASNLGVDPVAEAAAIYQAQPGVCFHIISFADTPEGVATLDKIAALNSCTVKVDGADLLANPAAVDKFVADVFYDIAGEEVLMLRGVNFAFDSSVLDAKSQSILNEVATLLKASPNQKVLLEGWTDSVGTDAYNMGLSQRRADSVKTYLVKQGIPATNILAAGKGKSFKYDNATAEGRYLNRRVEIVFN